MYGAFDIYSTSYINERIIFLSGEINQDTANVVVAQMLHLAYADPKKDIKLYINSSGGGVYDGMAIYDTMRYIKPWTCQTSESACKASMGALLLSSGTKGKEVFGYLTVKL